MRRESRDKSMCLNSQEKHLKNHFFSNTALYIISRSVNKLLHHCFLFSSSILVD